MAIARKCDRCGKLFEPNVKHNGHVGLHSHISITYYSNLGICVEQVSGMDLCPNCHDELIVWLHAIHNEEHSKNNSSIGRKILCDDSTFKCDTCIRVGDSDYCDYCGISGIDNYKKEE